MFACSVCLINAPFHCKTLSQPEQQTGWVTRAPPGGEYVATQSRHRLAGPQLQVHLQGAGHLPSHEQLRSVTPPESRFHLIEALFMYYSKQNNALNFLIVKELNFFSDDEMLTLGLHTHCSVELAFLVFVVLAPALLSLRQGVSFDRWLGVLTSWTYKGLR